MFSLVRSSARTLVVVLLAYLYSRLLLYTRAYRLSFSAFLAVVRFKRARLGISRRLRVLACFLCVRDKVDALVARVSSFAFSHVRA